MRTFIAVSAIAILSACATGANDGPREPVTVDTPPSAVVPDTFDLAMGTVDQLVLAGNEQTAIDRLTQLLGSPDLSDEDLAATLYKRAELRHGSGHDVRGAMTDINELLNTYPDSSQAADAAAFGTSVQAELDALQSLLAAGDLAPTEEFNVLFRLGDHQEAADLMLARGLSPENGYVVDMFQMGYLCDDESLTGPGYDMTEPDGTVRTVRFCEFGK